MRASFLVHVLFAVLALQLAFGLQVDVAYATPMRDSMNAVQDTAVHAQPSDDACPMHSTSMDAPMYGTAATDSASATTAPHVKVPHDNSPGKHDCCKSSCQCQCGNAPLAFSLTATRGVLASVYLRPVAVIRVAHAPTDTHFRPPIA